MAITFIMKRVHFAAAALTLAAVCGCSSDSKPPAGASAPPAHAGGIDLAGMDTSTAPGDDFFGYANGTWFKKTEISPDRSTAGTWTVLGDLAQQRTRELIENLAKPGAATSPDEHRIADYFTSYMDESAIESKGLDPIKPFLTSIAAIADRRALSSYACGEIRADVDALNNTNFETDRIFGIWISPALDEPTSYVPYLMQGGLGLPDRDYYTDTSADMQKVLDAYKGHIATILRLAGIANPDQVAARVLAFETKIAGVHATRTQSVDVMHANNPWPRAEFATRAPGLDWNACFEAAGLTQTPRLIVWHPDAVKGISALAGKEAIDVWRDYLTFHAINRYAGLLPKAFADENFAFYGKVLSGTEVQRPRWKRAVDSTSNALGDLVGQLYVRRFFPPESKQQVQLMVKNLVAAFDKRVEALDWMDPKTKASARAKLGTLQVGIGYPDTWRSYSSLEVKSGEALMNAWRAERFNYLDNLAKLGRPVARNEWAMTPQTVNALNLPILNGMNFPAAILEPPFFDPSASVAANYGSIGAIIGHEISHSFDDQGSQFDASGKLQNWWTPADFAHFKETSRKLVEQYNAYVPMADLHINGQLTLSENIADLAGLAAAYGAYREADAAQRRAPAGNFTSDQEFFISFGQSWRSKMREPLLRQLILTDGHAPDRFRAATVRNIDAWYEAFGVKAGQQLFLAPADRVRVW
jgi:predicted metalloendopeptidase